MTVTQYAAGTFTPFGVGTGFEDMAGEITEAGVYVAILSNAQLTGTDAFRFQWRSWNDAFTTEINWPDPPIEMPIPSGDGSVNSGIVMPPFVFADGQSGYLIGTQYAGSGVTDVAYIINRIT